MSKDVKYYACIRHLLLAVSNAHAGAKQRHIAFHQVRILHKKHNHYGAGKCKRNGCHVPIKLERTAHQSTTARVCARICARTVVLSLLDFSINTKATSLLLLILPTIDTRTEAEARRDQVHTQLKRNTKALSNSRVVCLTYRCRSEVAECVHIGVKQSDRLKLLGVPLSAFCACYHVASPSYVVKEACVLLTGKLQGSIN